MMEYTDKDQPKTQEHGFLLNPLNPNLNPASTTHLGAKTVLILRSMRPATDLERLQQYTIKENACPLRGVLPVHTFFPSLCWQRSLPLHRRRRSQSKCSPACTGATSALCAEAAPTASPAVASQPATFYFGSVGGGVWKTVNAGHTWFPIC